MRKTIYIAILLAWFVGIRAPHDVVAGAFMSMVVGPFKTLADCKAQQRLLETLAEELEGAVVTGCKEMT